MSDQNAVSREPLQRSVERLDAIAGESDGWHALEDATREELRRLETGNVDATRWLRAALVAAQYRFTAADGRIGFEPRLILADGTTDPPTLDKIPDDAVGDWLMLRESATHPSWRSRLGHLAIDSERVLVGTQRMLCVDEVIDDYLAIPSMWGASLDAVDALEAALGLERRFSRSAKRSLILATITDAATKALSERDPSAGVVLALSRCLVGRPESSQDASSILVQARSLFAGDPFLLHEVIGQQIDLSVGNEDLRRELRRERVMVWMDAAEETDGVRRSGFLQKAIELASDGGDGDLRTEATRRLQEMTLRDLDLQGLHTGVVLRGEEIANAVRQVTDAPDWIHALDYWAQYGPPTGRTADNRRYVEQHVLPSLSAIFPHTIVGGDGLPRFSPRNEEEKYDLHLCQHESMNLQLQGPLVAEGLLRLPSHFDLPSSADLSLYFMRNPLIGVALAGALSRAFHRWWSGDYEGAAFTVTPRIETLARQLLLSADVAVYRLQREKSPGQYAGLGYLLAVLREHGLLAEDWHRYLSTFLASQPGANQRNELSHGFLDDVNLVKSALLLHCAAHLAIAPILIDEDRSGDQ